MEDKKPKLTRQTGAPVGDNQNVQTAGTRGLMIMQDAWFFKKRQTLTVKSFQKDECTPKALVLLERLR